MSFLHGVLESVKDDESVTTYDIDRSNDINNVLRILHDSVGKGRKAFPEAVRQVDTFTGRVTGHLGKYYQEVEKKQGEDLTTQLSGWKGTVGKIQDEVNNIETYNVNVLDSTLKNRLMHEMSVIHSSVLLLKNSANEEVFGLQVKQVDSTLVKQRDDVLQKINEECAVLQTRQCCENDRGNKSKRCRRRRGKLRQGFGEDAFKTAVTQWVKDIVNTDESIVSSKIYDYVMHNKSVGLLASENSIPDKVKKVKAAIIEHLPGHMLTDIQAIAQETLRGATVKNIDMKFGLFANQIGNKLTGDGSSIAEAVRKIRQHLNITQMGHLMPNSTDPRLTNALNAIAKSLINNFKQVAEELKRFLEKSKLHPNLEKAIEKVKEIGEKISIDELANGPGKNINDALKIVNGKITVLNKLLKDTEIQVQWSKSLMKFKMDSLSCIISRKKRKAVEFGMKGRKPMRKWKS
ncbi:hypothetical protein, conserved [Babesia ovata]|uniref:Uncharacterized protein n=1 Tax=Babesia ovata TaxID=189622 RepID=A0A2H6KJ41_9APIC|nr:uncharacterized protein BOVATA_045050 [Babesia ovata]GBE63012.1 hypothetical protein, conserved [Babesia ovata]